MSKPRLPKSTIECPTCSKSSGLALGPGFSRRRFLKVAGTGLVASYFADVLSPSLLQARTVAPNVFLRKTAKNAIFIFLPGAPSNTDLWDLKEGLWTPAAFAPTDFNGGTVRFAQGLLPETSKHLDRLTFVHPGLAWAAVHQLGQEWAQIARNPTGATGSIAPHIGAVVSLESQISRAPGDVLPGFIALNSAGIPTSGYFPASYAPFMVQPASTGLATLNHPDGAARFADRWNLLQALDTNRNSGALGKTTLDANDFYIQSKTLMDSPGINQLFAFSSDEHTRYGASTFGDSLIVARNLVNAHKGTRFVQVSFGGWDHHSNIYQPTGPGLFTQAKAFDPGFGALMTDLRSMPGTASGASLLDETLVVITAEFGRTTGAPNGQQGRDHALRMSTVWAGGGVRGGQVIGKTDATGSGVVDYGWSGNRDVRPEDVTSTIYSALGIDYTTVRKDDPLGRGFEYVPFAKDGTYKPVDELF